TLELRVNQGREPLDQDGVRPPPPDSPFKVSAGGAQTPVQRLPVEPSSQRFSMACGTAVWTGAGLSALIVAGHFKRLGRSGGNDGSQADLRRSGSALAGCGESVRTRAGDAQGCDPSTRRLGYLGAR